jgi:hypothetical protein
VLRRPVRLEPVGGGLPPLWAARSRLIGSCVLHRGRLGEIPSLQDRDRRLPIDLLRCDPVSHAPGPAATSAMYVISVPSAALDPRSALDAVELLNRAQDYARRESNWPGRFYRDW